MKLTQQDTGTLGRLGVYIPLRPDIPRSNITLAFIIASINSIRCNSNIKYYKILYTYEEY